MEEVRFLRYSLGVKPVMALNWREKLLCSLNPTIAASSAKEVDGASFIIACASGKIDTPDRANSIARELWSLMIHVTDAIETGYQYTNYEFSYGGGTVKITGLKYDDSQGWTITSLSECTLTNVSGFTGSLAYEDQNTHSARSSSSGTYYKRQMSLQTIGSGYPMKYKDDKLESSFSTSLYKDNSSSLLRPNDKFGSMYADTDPVSGTLKNDAGSAFSIFFN